MKNAHILIITYAAAQCLENELEVIQRDFEKALLSGEARMIENNQQNSLAVDAGRVDVMKRPKRRLDKDSVS
jgi:hypothetical protein